MIVNPFLVFIGFYKIGKIFDLKSNLKSLIIRLLSGAYLGHFLSYNVAYLSVGNDSIWFDSYLSIFIGSVFSFLGTFFAAFTALAIGYLRHNESEIQWKKPETHTCPKCGNFLPKKEAKVSGWDSQSSITHIHCPECDVAVNDNVDLNKKQFEIQPFKFEINWFVPFVFSFAFISPIFFMQEIYLTLIFTFVVMVLFFVIFVLVKRLKKKP